MSAIVSGIVGGAAVTLLFIYSPYRRKRNSSNGILKFDGLRWLAATLAAFIAYASIFQSGPNVDPSSPARLLVLIVSCASAIYLYAEAAMVKGIFDNRKLEFRTPWTGKKSEAWDELIKCEHVDILGWTSLTFKSGKTIRLSRWLIGYQEAMAIAAMAVNRNVGAR